MTDLKPAPTGHPIKLVRDRTASIVNPTGEPGDLFYAHAEPEVVRPWLRKKLVEEVAEFLVDGGIDELCDVVSVVAAIAEHEFNTSAGRLLARAGDDPRGGFFDGVMMYGYHAEFDGSSVS